MKIGNKIFELENKAYIMGILNVTPDSFSDGGKWNNLDQALKHTNDMIKEGASIIDIGGESTRLGYIHVTEDEEINRVVPYIEAIKKEFDIPISIDTYKAKVADAAVCAGASLVNDIWGFKGDENMAKVVAKHKVPVCIMHNRDNKLKPYTDFLTDVIEDLKESINIGLKNGVDISQMITDPGVGVGFGKTFEQNLMIMNKVEILSTLNCPILLGTSRKSMIGLALDLPVEERVEGTIATTVMGVMKGCSIIRVHDVQKNYRAMVMTEKVLGRY